MRVALCAKRGKESEVNARREVQGALELLGELASVMFAGLR